MFSVFVQTRKLWNATATAATAPPPLLPSAGCPRDRRDGLTRLIPVQALTDSGMQFRIEIQRNSRELEWAAEERTMRRPPAKRRRRTGNMLEFLQFATRGARVGSSINDVRTPRTKRGGRSKSRYYKLRECDREKMARRPKTLRTSFMSSSQAHQS